MKRHLLLLLVALLPMLVNAYDAKINGIYYNFSGNEAMVTYQEHHEDYPYFTSDYSGVVVIPASVTYNGKTYSVTSIGTYAFSGCTSLTSVTIGNSVTSIGHKAFYGCSGLTSVTIGSGVTSIGHKAFSGCTSLTSVTIGNSVTSIGADAFSSCSSLTSVYITDLTAWCNITFGYSSSNPLCYAHNLYLNGQKIKDLVIPNSVTSIGGYAFYGCSGLTSITIPNSVTSIGNQAFRNCSGLTKVYCYAEILPQTSSYAFENSPIASATLYVPESSVNSYKSRSPWSEFGEIQPLPKYSLTYIVDGDVYQTFEVEYGSTISPEPAPTKEGYTFSGWSEIPTIMPAHDVTVTGSFTINSYTLTYKVDGNVYKTSTIKYGTRLTPEPAPTKEGYTFSGWSEIPETMPAHDVTVTGSFTINSYTLTYKVDDEEYKTYTVAYGDAIIPEEEPTKEGYTFSGWSEIPTTMPAHDVVVTGSFSINSYTLTYKVNGSVYKTYSIVYGTAITPESMPTKKGMTFSGWGNVPATMPAYNVTLSGTYSWLKEVVDGVIYQVADTLNNYASVVGKQNINGEATILSNIEMGGFVYTVNTIGENAFKSCSTLTSVTIPESVTSIVNNAFSGCSNLTSVTLNSNALVSATRSSSTSMKSIFGNQVKEYVIGDDVIEIGSSAFYNCSNLTSIKIGDNVRRIGSNAFYGCNNAKLYVNRGTDALLSVWNYGNDPYETGTSQRLARPSVSVTSTTQTTIGYIINNVYPELEYSCTYNEVSDDDEYLITGLRPQYTQTIYLAVSSANNSYNTSRNATTSSISPTVISKNVTASSLTIEGTYIEGDARVVSKLLIVNGEETNDAERRLYGLDPNRSYTFKCKVVVEDDNGATYSYEGSSNIRTASLTLTTQQPKVITVGNVVVAANSNLDDEETNVGFEWRRIDWTDEFASNTGVAYLYEGTMEGYIRNMFTEKLWKYRPFYQSNSGNRYYGEWVGIDPTNTSYFEPTVHTYAQITVQGNRADVKGYAMRGTDNVTSQGFMYWPNNTSFSLRRKATSIPENVTVVRASGNVMTATLEDLEYETTYSYVAFVTTSEGETFYGEVQTFRTSFDPDGIKTIDNGQLTIDNEEAWYDLSGRKIVNGKLPKGINILLHSDGTSKKVLIK